MLEYIKFQVIPGVDFLFSPKEKHENKASEEFGILSFFLHFYLAEGLNGCVEEWLSDEPDEIPFFSEFMYIVKHPNDTFSFMFDDEYEKFKKNPNANISQITISKKNLISLLHDFYKVDKNRPMLGYIINHNGWIYIDTKLPDEVGVEITKVQKE